MKKLLSLILIFVIFCSFSTSVNPQTCLTTLVYTDCGAWNVTSCCSGCDDFILFHENVDAGNALCDAMSPDPF